MLPLGIALVYLAGCMPPGPQALVEGKRLIEQGQYSQAASQLRIATSLLSTNAQAWNFLGLALHYTGQADEAQKAYQRALNLNPDLAETRYNLGCLFVSQNKLEAAKGEFIAYSLRRGNVADGFVKLGLVQMWTSEQHNPQQRSVDLGAAEKCFNDALRLSPQSPEAWNGLGLVRLQRGRVVEAAQSFSNALNQLPPYRPALLNLAIVSQEYLRDAPAALGRYREYLALKPRPDNADAVQALVHDLQEQVGSNPPPSALTQGVPAEPATTNPPTPSFGDVAGPKPAKRGFLQRIFGMQPKAVSKPGNDGVQNASGAPVENSGASTASTNAAGAGTAPARFVYQASINLKAGNRTEATRWFEAGIQAQKGRRLSEAERDYRKATQADPAFFEAHYNLGLAAAAASDLPVALVAYQNSLELRPESLDARYNFALVLQRAGYPADAASELERLLVAYPNEPRAHLALGTLYAQQLHQPAKARLHYLKVIEIDPHNPQTGAVRRWLADNP
jgi:tetratricopeptide (TPR) repeat protein